MQAFKRSGRLFVVKPVMIFYALSFAVTMSITRLGILYTIVMFIITDNYSTAAPSKNVIGRVVNFVTTGNRVLYDAMK